MPNSQTFRYTLAMNSFLNSPAWQRFQQRVGHVPLTQDGQLYLRQEIPGFLYYTASRLELGEQSTLPELPTETCFIRLEPLDAPSLIRLQELSPRNLVSTFAVQPRQTSLLNLQQSPDQILEGMSQKHRYNVRLAEKKGVKIEHFSDDATAQFDRFWKLTEATANRQDFRTHEAEYYKAMLEELRGETAAHLFFATFEDQDLASLLLITHQGTATYLHGASSDLHKNLMAPHRMQFRAMQFAQSLGATTYDFWGTDAVETETGWEAKSGALSAGVTRFKLGFGGTIVNYPGTFDLVLRPFWYRVYSVIRALRSRKRAFS